MGALFREDMGRGKTLALYLYLWEHARRRVRRGEPRFGPGCPTLILVPKTLLGQWEEQWQRWMGVQRLGVLFLPPGHDLDVDLDWFHHCVDAVVMTYETLVGAIRDERCDGLLAVHWRHLVVEEGTTLSHEETHLFDACARVNADARILISAEPLLNARTRELNGIIAFFGCKTRLPLSLDDDDADTRPDLAAARERRRALLAHFDVHSTKPIGVARDFDARRDPKPRWVTLREDERQQYNKVFEFFKLTKERDERLRALTMLRKIVLSSHLLSKPEERDPHRRPSSKMEAVLLYLRTAVAADEKVLIFCDWQRAHVELSFHLTRAGVSHAILDASLTPLQRQLLVARFAEPDGPRVVLVTYKLSVGMDGWQCANHVLLMSGWWHNKVERQALGRIERPGQTRVTHFYKFIVEDSIDHYMLATNISKETRGSRVFSALDEPTPQAGCKRARDESDDDGGEEEDGAPPTKRPRLDTCVC
jgi:SNF2 family DNA or RNA helicase